MNRILSQWNFVLFLQCPKYFPCNILYWMYAKGEIIFIHFDQSLRFWCIWICKINEHKRDLEYLYTQYSIHFGSCPINSKFAIYQSINFLTVPNGLLWVYGRSVLSPLDDHLAVSVLLMLNIKHFWATYYSRRSFLQNLDFAQHV